MNEDTLYNVFQALNIDRDEVTAKAYGLTYVDNQLVAKFIDHHGDIYMLIDNIDNDKILANTNFDYFAIITHGWAAPLDQDGNPTGTPSLHPERRRVRLIVTVDLKNDNDVASALEFGDDPENLIYDHGTATGSLADAVASLFE